jgi:putative redox protein
MARAHGEIGLENYRVSLRAGHHDLVADEAPALGGADAGPSPYELLLSGLAACTAITLRMYAERKAWPLEGLKVDLLYRIEDGRPRIERTVVLAGTLDDAQRTRLAEVAERTPVTLTLKSGVEIATQFREAVA